MTRCKADVHSWLVYLQRERAELHNTEKRELRKNIKMRTKLQINS